MQRKIYQIILNGKNMLTRVEQKKKKKKEHVDKIIKHRRVNMSCMARRKKKILINQPPALWRLSSFSKFTSLIPNPFPCSFQLPSSSTCSLSSTIIPIKIEKNAAIKKHQDLWERQNYLLSSFNFQSESFIRFWILVIIEFDHVFLR